MPNRKDEKATVLSEREGRRILGASIEFVCASKMRAGRMKDIYDLQFVMGKTGWTSSQLAEIHDHAYSQGPDPAPGQVEAIEHTMNMLKAWELRGRQVAPEIRAGTPRTRTGGFD